MRLTSLQLDGLVGAQLPRVESVPLFHTSAGDDAIDLAAAAGLFLDDWQQHVLRGSLGERVDGKWAAFEVGLCVPRQSGKNSILEARELAGLFLFGEKMQVHTAHLFPTAKEHQLRMESLIRGCDLVEHVKGYKGDPNGDMSGLKTGNQDLSITLKNGNRLKFLARSGGNSGRGFTGDLVVLDEAYLLPDSVIAALMPTMSARSMTGSPQIWYASSAGMPDSEVLWRIRSRGLAGGDESLAYFEWSADDEDPDFDPGDPAQWAIANPGLGIRISPEFVANEFRSMGAEEFARERLGVWSKIGDDAFIPPSAWFKCRDEVLAEMVVNGEVIDQKLDRLAFGVDIPPDRSSATISVSGTREDGSLFVGLVDRREGTEWVASELRSLMGPRRVPVLADGFSAVSSLAMDFRRERVRVIFLRSDVYKKACGVFYDKVVQGQLSHKGDADLDAAVSGAQPSSKEKLWAWTSKSVDVSPLVAATLAVHGSLNRPSGDKSAKRRGAVFA